MAPPKGKRCSPETEFRPGIVPKNKLPIGATTVRQHRGDSERTWIKVGEPNIWIPNAVYVWLSNGGTIPDGFTVHHRDGNTLNDEISNLGLLTRASHLELHRAMVRAGWRKAISERGGVRVRVVVCSSCGTEFRGKARRKKALCPSCARKRQNESSCAYKQRIRAQRRREQQPDSA